MLNIRSYPGWIGQHTRDEAPGALPNGSRVRKIKEDPGGDSTPIGTLGTVLGSLWEVSVGYAYFVEWDGRPRLARLVVGWKIADVRSAAGRPAEEPPA